MHLSIRNLLQALLLAATCIFFVSAQTPEQSPSENKQATASHAHNQQPELAEHTTAAPTAISTPQRKAQNLLLAQNNILT